MSDNFQDNSVKRLNSMIIEKEFETPDFIYIDLALVKDFYVGAAIEYLKTQPNPDVLYDRMMKSLHLHQTRITHTPHALCRALDTSPEMLGSIIANKSSDVCLSSPMTPYPNTLRAHQTININHSQVSEKFKKVQIAQGKYIKEYEDVVFVINIWPLTSLNQEMHNLVAKFFRDNFLVNVLIIREDPEKIAVDFYTKCDHLHLYYLTSFLKNTRIHELMATTPYLDKRLFAAPLFDIENPQDYPEKRIFAEMEFAKSRLNTNATFEWIPKDRYAVKPDLFTTKE